MKTISIAACDNYRSITPQISLASLFEFIAISVLNDLYRIVNYASCDSMAKNLQLETSVHNIYSPIFSYHFTESSLRVLWLIRFVYVSASILPVHRRNRYRNRSDGIINRNQYRANFIPSVELLIVPTLIADCLSRSCAIDAEDPAQECV